jgi:hypothetical protein
VCLVSCPQIHNELWVTAHNAKCIFMERAIVTGFCWHCDCLILVFLGGGTVCHSSHQHRGVICSATVWVHHLMIFLSCHIISAEESAEILYQNQLCRQIPSIASMQKSITTQIESSLPDLFTTSLSPSHIDLCCLKVTVLSPLQWGHQTLSSFGFPTYPHSSHMCSSLSVW